MKYLLISIFIASLRPSLSEEIFVTVNKTCDSYNNTNSTENLKLEKFNGPWYEIAKYGKQENCTRYNIQANSNTTVFNVSHYHNFQNTYNSSFIIEQLANNELRVNASNSTGIHKIIATDLKDFKLIWFCSNLNNSNSNQTLVILSNRTSTLNVNEITNLLNTTYAIDAENLRPTNQSGAVCQAPAQAPAPSSGNISHISIIGVIMAVLSIVTLV